MDLNNFINDLEGELTGKGKVHNKKIHLRIQQRTGRKSITIVEGLTDRLPDKQDIKKLLKKMRKKFSCGGSQTLNDDNESIILLNGDHRSNISSYLTKKGVCEHDDIVIHGY